MTRLATPDLVAAIRRANRQSQEDLARALGVSFASVNAWERGRTEPRDRHRAALDELAADVGIRQGLTVLIIDDDPEAADLAQAVVRLLEPEAEIRVAFNGSDGLLTLGSLKPDLVMLDIRMPGIDGIEVAEAMTRVPGLERTVLIFVTSSDDPETRARAAVTTAAELIAKPLTRADAERAIAYTRDESSQRVEVAS